MKPKEQALITQTRDVQLYGEGKALQQMAWRVKHCVPNGNRLQEHEALSLAQIALATGLNPFTGELWYIPSKGPMAGIRGLRRRAREQSTYSLDFRGMTEEEVKDHGIKPEDAGRVCLVFRHDVLQRAVEINKAAKDNVVPVKPIEGIGIWRKGDQVPSGKSPRWMADKRAEADGLRKAFDLTELPYSDEVNGEQLEIVEGEASGWAPIDEPTEKSIGDLFGDELPSVEPEETVYEIRDEGRTRKGPISDKRNGWPVRPWDAETLGQAMAVKVAAYKGKSIAPTPEQLDYCRSSLGKLNLGDPERHTITLYLFGKESTSELTAAECSALIDWVGAKEENNYEISQDAKVEACAAIKQYQIEAGQTEMAM